MMAPGPVGGNPLAHALAIAQMRQRFAQAVAQQAHTRAPARSDVGGQFLRSALPGGVTGNPIAALLAVLGASQAPPPMTFNPGVGHLADIGAGIPSYQPVLPAAGRMTDIGV